MQIRDSRQHVFVRRTFSPLSTSGRLLHLNYVTFPSVLRTLPFSTNVTVLHWRRADHTRGKSMVAPAWTPNFPVGLTSNEPFDLSSGDYYMTRYTEEITTNLSISEWIKTVAQRKVAGSGGVRSMFDVEHVQPQPRIVEYNINAGQNRLPGLRDKICS
jgi:hypothetical protein